MQRFPSLRQIKEVRIAQFSFVARERMETAMEQKTRQFDAALGVVGKLRAAGYEAYLAGGCVRDLLLGLTPKDYDVATSATPDVVLGLFPRTFAVGAHFGVVLVATCGAADAACAAGDELGGPGYVVTEVATFGRMELIQMAAVPMRFGIRRAPRKTSGGGILRSMGCCSIRCAKRTICARR